MSLSIQSTGFVSDRSGSVASANAMLLRHMMARGHRVKFYTKPSFVDPRPSVADLASENMLDVVDCTNAWSDGLRRCLSPRGRGLWGLFWGKYDAFFYNRGLARAMQRSRDGDVDLWLGDWARGHGARPVVSFVQGPPGSDARSIGKHRQQIERLAGKTAWLKLAAYAAWRLGPGLPKFKYSDHVIVGSQWSRNHLVEHYTLPTNRTHALPYPIDLQMFRPTTTRRASHDRLRVFWLGRFVPRKRLDVFLDGLALAIRHGCDVEAWVVGKSGFVPGYERLLDEFPYPERLTCWSSVPRDEVPAMLENVDVMAQPSDDEDFGSSVAEALACGIPAIVGATNGTSDYLCERSIKLRDDRSETFAEAVVKLSDAKRAGQLVDPMPSRLAAETWFDPGRVVDRLESILRLAAESSNHFLRP